MTYVKPVQVAHRAITLRPFNDGDYAAVAGLYQQHDREFTGETNFTEDMVRAEYSSQVNFNPSESVRIAETEDGAVVGMCVLLTNHAIPVRPNSWIMALPERADDVIPALLDWCVERATSVFDCVPENARVVLQSGAHHDNIRASKHFRAHGFTSERCFYSMRIRFNGIQPPASSIPEGIRLVTYMEFPHVEQFARAVKFGFADHRGAAADTPFDYYVNRMRRVIAESRFDPTIWWLALDAQDNIAGVCTSFNDTDEFPDTGHVQQLAVLPAFRRKGLALALLHTSFAEHFRRGRDGVSLGVDGASLTNAVALYERAGMSIASQWDAYELELRPGLEITKQ